MTPLPHATTSTQCIKPAPTRSVSRLCHPSLYFPDDERSLRTTQS